MIKAIIFDADGVIIQAVTFSKQYQHDFGISNDEMIGFFKGRFQECLVGKADLKKEIEKHLKDWKWEKSVDEFLEYWFQSEHSINQKLIEYIQILRKKNIVYCMGTNQEKYRTEYMLKKMGFEDTFDMVFSSAHIGFKKPEVEFFRIAVERLKVQPDEVMFWDDTSEHIEAAKKFGMHAFFYSSFEEFKTVMKKYPELS